MGIATRNTKARKAYMVLVEELPLWPISNEKELDRAIKMLDRLLDEQKLSAGGQAYLDVLTRLVSDYEDQHHTIEPAQDHEMLQLLLDQHELRPARLSRDTGICDSTISSVLSGKRRLTRDQISLLAEFFSVSPALFV